MLLASPVPCAHWPASLGSQKTTSGWSSILEGLGGEASALDSLEQITRQIQEAVQGLAQGLVTGARDTGELLQGLMDKASLKQWSHCYKLVAGARDERFNRLLQWAQAWEPNAFPRPAAS